MRQTHTLYKNKVHCVADEFESYGIEPTLLDKEKLIVIIFWFFKLQASMELEQKEGEADELKERLGDLQRRYVRTKVQNRPTYRFC